MDFFWPCLAISNPQDSDVGLSRIKVEPASAASKSEFKSGPVTDDNKLIKPVTTEKKDQPKGLSKENDSVDNTTGGDTHSNRDLTINEKGPISVGAFKIANDLDIVEAISLLSDYKRNHIYKPGQKVHSIEVISVRQDLDETLLSAFLQTRKVVSQLDRQIAGYDAVARVLEEKRDQAIHYNDILNFTSGGALAITQGAISIGTPMKYQNTGNELGAIAGALTAMISSYAIKIQHGGKRDAEVDPNMLAPLFGLEKPDARKYPLIVWNYLSDYEPGQSKTRKEQLIERWVKLRYIEPLNKTSSPDHLARLSGTVSLHKGVTIDMLRDRIPMLQDVRAAVAGINEYLDEILSFVRQP